jgi:hypothetical protein
VIPPLKTAKAPSGCAESEDCGSPPSERGVNEPRTELSQQLTAERTAEHPAELPTAAIPASAALANSRRSAHASTEPSNRRSTPLPRGSADASRHHQHPEGTTQVVHLANFRRGSSNLVPSRKPSMLSRSQLAPGDRPGSAAASMPFHAAAVAAAATVAAGGPGGTGGPGALSTASSFTMARSNTGCAVDLASSSQLPTLPSAAAINATIPLHVPGLAMGLAMSSLASLTAVTAMRTSSEVHQRGYHSPAGPSPCHLLAATGGGAGGPDILSSVLSEGYALPPLVCSSLLPSGELSRLQSMQAGGLSCMLLNADTGHISTTAVEQLRQQILCEQQQGLGGRPIEVGRGVGGRERGS